MTAALMVLTVVLAAAVAVPVAVLPLVSRVRPSIAVPLLAVGSLISTASVGVVLSLLALAVVGRIPAVADLGGWSIGTLETAVPVPPAIGVSATAVVIVLIARALLRAVRILLVLERSDRLSRRLRRGGGPIVLVDDDAADAFTLAGLRGCVVISRGLLTALGPAERRMLTGHEMSHLRRRHHLFVHAVDLAVAANPLLHKAPAAVRLGVERWADEDAAPLAGDRDAAASAVARIALIRAQLRRTMIGDSAPPVPLLGIAASHITHRATALLAPAPRGAAVAIWVSTLVLATFAGAVASTLQIHNGFEIAEMAWLTANR